VPHADDDGQWQPPDRFDENARTDRRTSHAAATAAIPIAIQASPASALAMIASAGRGRAAITTSRSA
jgi:hypothetical protein